MQKVGRITAWNEGCLEVFWNPETREIRVHETGWFSRFPKPPVVEESVSEPIHSTTPNFGIPNHLRGLIPKSVEEHSLWHIPQSDCNIIGSVAMYLGCLPQDLCADQIMVFDQKERHGKADEQLDTDIYDCDWSDFACDGLVLHFNVRSYSVAKCKNADCNLCRLAALAVAEEETYKALAFVHGEENLEPERFDARMAYELALKEE